HLGAGPDTLAEIAAGRPAFAATIAKAEPAIVLIGQRALARPDGAAVASLAARLAVDLGAVKDGWNGYSMLHTAAARGGALDVGLLAGEGGRSAVEMAKAGVLDVAFLLGVDEIEIAPGAFAIYIGT